MIVLVDSDVMLDVAQARQPFAKDSATVLDLLQQGIGKGIVSWHSLANVYYLIRPVVGHGNSLDVIRELGTFLEIVATTNRDLEVALRTPMRDFEDAMQVAAAASGRADFIVTRNHKDFAKSPVPAISPKLAIAHLVSLADN